MKLVPNNYFFKEGYTGNNLIVEIDDDTILLSEEGSFHKLVIHKKAIVDLCDALLPVYAKAE